MTPLFSLFGNYWSLLRPLYPQLLGLPSSIQKVTEGEVHVSTLPTGTPQDTTGGPAVTTITTVNAARIVLELEKAGTRGWPLLEAMMSTTFIERIVQISPTWTSSANLEIDDIHTAPLFRRSLDKVEYSFRKAGLAELKELIEAIQRLLPHTSTATIFTGPFDTIAAFNIKTAISTFPEMIVVFDGRPRSPEHPDGPAFLFFPTLDAAIAHLFGIFTADPTMQDDDGNVWLSSHTFAVRPGREDTLAGTYDANLNFLAATSQVKDLQRTSAESELRASDLRTRLETVEKSSRILRDEGERWKTEIDGMRAKILTLEAAKANAESQAEDARTDAANERELLTQEIEDLRYKISTLQSKYAATEQEKVRILFEAKRELDAHHNDMAAMSAEISQGKNKIRELEAARSSIQEEKQMALSEVEKIRAASATEVANMRAEIQAVQASRATTEQEKKVALANVAKEKSQLEKQLSQTQERLNQSSSAFQSLQQETQRATREISDLQTTIQALETARSVDSRDHEKAVAEANLLRNKLGEEIARLQAETRSQDTAKAELTRQNTDLNTRLRSAEQARRAAEEQKERAIAETLKVRSAVRAEIAELKAGIFALQSSSASADDMRALLDGEMASLKTQLREAEAARVAAEEEKEKAFAAARDAQTSAVSPIEVLELQTKVASLSSALEDSTRAAAEAERTRAELGALNREAISLNDLVKRLRAEIKSLESANIIAEREREQAVNTANSNIQALQSRIRSLENAKTAAEQEKERAIADARRARAGLASRPPPRPTPGRASTNDSGSGDSFASLSTRNVLDYWRTLTQGDNR